MSAKSSTVRCLLNVVVKVLRNCCERTLKCDQVDSGCTFEKNTTIVTKVVLIQLFSSSGSKQRIKIKIENIMASSYRLKVSSTQNKGVPFFFCLNHGV